MRKDLFLLGEDIRIGIFLDYLKLIYLEPKPMFGWINLLKLQKT